MSGTIELTEKNFETRALLTTDKPVLVDFWASWCAPCRAMQPVLEALARELDGDAIIGKVNVDDEPQLAAAARIRAIPTLVLLKNGKVEDVLVGVQTKEKLKHKIERLTAPAPDDATSIDSERVQRAT